MDEKDAFAARREAREDVTAHPEWPLHHADIRSYVAGIAHAQARPYAFMEMTEPAQPVDEPAPPAVQPELPASGHSPPGAPVTGPVFR